jgi:putative transposase
MEIYKEYKHNPPHLFIPNATYLITGSVIRKFNYLDTDAKKAFFCEVLQKQSQKFNWRLDAWACLHNHYHFVGKAPENIESIVALIRAVHSLTARFINDTDGKPGRRVWWNYWDTCIRDEKSYLTMLRYVHENPVKHQLIEKAEDYPFSSYQWFMRVSDSDYKELVLSQDIQQIQVLDDF